MKNQIGVSILSSVIGGGLVLLSLPFFNSNASIDVLSESEENASHVKMVSLEKENNTFELPNLTYSAKKTVETVVYIKTHFVKEEITYDPYLKLFYGKDAYRKRERHGQASGSGVIISDDGYIVTNNHVVQNAKSISVTINKKTYTGELVGSDPSTDIAVIKINAKGLNYSEFGNSDDLELGEWVLAVGNPLNLQSTVTAGIISAKNRNIDLLTSSYNPTDNVFPIESFIQTDAAVNSGNSGGALVNKEGELIGINTAIASNTGSYTGYSFAVPSNIVKKVTFDLIKHGTVKRVMLGVNIVENDSELQTEYNLSTNEGIVISGIVTGGTASQNKLKVRDIITKINGKSINSTSQLQAEISLINPGEKITIEYVRGNTTKQKEIMLE
jgi:S1-C subfamily serine protease